MVRISILIILGIAFLGIVLSSTTNAFYADNSNSTTNTFAAATSFPTATPSATLTPSPVPIANTLVINEVLPVSSCTQGQDNGLYIELWNGTNADVNLQQYKLSDGTTTFAISNSSTNLASGQFALLVKSEGVVNQCIDDKNGVDVNGAMTLNLGGNINFTVGTLQLLDSADNVVDTIKWGTGQVHQPATDQSIERAPTGKDSAVGTGFIATDIIIKELYTPGFGTLLTLNEYLPDPSVTFTDEFVEIYNPSNSSINLTGWSLKDIALTAKSLTGLGSIAASSRVTYTDSGDGWLNNGSAETLKLSDNLGRTMDQRSYNGSTADKTIGRQFDGQDPWKTCTTPTKNTSNNGSC
jgi:hypothetical protein